MFAGGVRLDDRYRRLYDHPIARSASGLPSSSETVDLYRLHRLKRRDEGSRAYALAVHMWNAGSNPAATAPQHVHLAPPRPARRFMPSPAMCARVPHSAASTAPSDPSDGHLDPPEAFDELPWLDDTLMCRKRLQRQEFMHYSCGIC